MERGDLLGYLIDLFSSWIGTDQESGVIIATVFRIEPYKLGQMYPRNINVKFRSWEAKVLFLKACRGQSEI